MHKTILVVSALVSLSILGCAQESRLAIHKNGFDLSKLNIPLDEIFGGGPPRDGIPSINDPKFTPLADATSLRDEEPVLGVVINGVARAYPLRILVWHEIVNDQIGDRAIAVTYCPLCGTGMIFDRLVEGKVRSFGVSGLLYQSDVLMYDRETESLWSQLGMRAVSGSSVDQRLTWLPSERMSWKAWREKYPESDVLSEDTGHSRAYGRSAYADYFQSDRIMFPVPVTRKELPLKSEVIGVLHEGKARAYSLADLSKQGSVQDGALTIHYDGKDMSHHAVNADGKVIPSVKVYWFAWQSFYPDTELWTP